MANIQGRWSSDSSRPQFPSIEGALDSAADGGGKTMACARLPLRHHPTPGLRRLTRRPFLPQACSDLTGKTNTDYTD